MTLSTCSALAPANTMPGKEIPSCPVHSPTEASSVSLRIGKQDQILDTSKDIRQKSCSGLKN